MKKIVFLSVCTLLLTAGLALGRPAALVNISCEGTLCIGGGQRDYQYTLQNIWNAPLTITTFYIGTQDLRIADYSNWIAPAGFTPAAAVATWDLLGEGYNVLYTTGTETSHGVYPTQSTFASSGGILWTGNAVIEQGASVTFGFDNPNESWDVQWYATNSATWTETGSVYVPIAGPTGTFTNGYVHSPVPEPATICLFGIGAFGLLRKRRA